MWNYLGSGREDEQQTRAQWNAMLTAEAGSNEKRAQTGVEGIYGGLNYPVYMGDQTHRTWHSAHSHESSWWVCRDLILTYDLSLSNWVVVHPLFMDVSLNGGTYPFHTPKNDHFFSRSLPMVVGETHHFRSCLHIRDDTLPSYIGIIISHYKDPYFTTSINQKITWGLVSNVSCGINMQGLMNHETRILSLTNQDDSWKVSEFFSFFAAQVDLR